MIKAFRNTLNRKKNEKNIQFSSADVCAIFYHVLYFLIRKICRFYYNDEDKVSLYLHETVKICLLVFYYLVTYYLSYNAEHKGKNKNKNSIQHKSRQL